MAIPFYENEHASASAAAPSDITGTATAGDQVDGPPFLDSSGFDQVDYEGPPPTAPASAATSEPPPSAEEQLLAWKILALTMCKVLKQFCQQHKQANGKASKLTATVQIQPQTQ